MTTINTASHMKWYGWGDTHKAFDITQRPALWPYIVRSFAIENNMAVTTPAKNLNEIILPSSYLNDAFLTVLRTIVKEDQIKIDDHERLLHTYGKSFRDLWRVRNGIISAAPDCVCYPLSEQEIVQLIDAAVTADVIIIPFGGGSNIAGCLEVRETHQRMVVSLDLRRMNRVIAIDHYSMTARVQPGTLGPQLEAQLNAQGMTLGHFPDSFEHSSIGGWVATRSAGMQSDKYGKIEDMVLAMRLVTPSGTLVTRTVPKSSNGINVNHLGVGSEGILGVITEVTVQVHPLPACKQFYGYLFPNFEAGVAAIYESVKQGCAPSMTRLNDIEKTALSFAYKTKTTYLKNLMATIFKWYLRAIRRFDFNTACLMLVAYEGSHKNVRRQLKKVNRIYRTFGGVNLGTSPGQAFEKGKYDFPYLRDFAMDRGLVADVSETATVWENLLPLYNKTRTAITDAITQLGVKPWCGCHISHTYHTGASLYFTFAFKADNNVLAHYDQVKQAAENAFMNYGGTVSHHHAIGYEHLAWIADDISLTGIKAIHGIKNAIDPKKIMNPGKLIPTI